MKKSAGILLFRFKDRKPEFFLVHPGGPFWKNKDDGSWSIPKGEFLDDEEPLAAARREFMEETGIELPDEKYIQLKPLRQKSGKLVYAWAIEFDADPEKIKSNLFELVWPPNSGNNQKFPEVDKAAWFDVLTTKRKILPGQMSFIEEMLEKLDR